LLRIKIPSVGCGFGRSLASRHVQHSEAIRLGRFGMGNEPRLNGACQAEALQYHHRCICQLQLEDYESAARDSSRNLEVFDFADEYAETDDMSWSLRQFHPQVLMLNVRAAASTHLHTSNFKKAIKEIEEGLEELKQFYESCGNTEYADQSPEFLSLETWLEDVKNQRPLSKREKLELDLQKAIQLEDFEKAAKVRDALRKLEKTKKS
jgi:excinuclease UvrABC helicase subunit UvrB